MDKLRGILRNLEDSQKWLLLSYLRQSEDEQLTVKEIINTLKELLDAES